jgi:hypothetical protein
MPSALNKIEDFLAHRKYGKLRQIILVPFFGRGSNYAEMLD